MIKLKHFLDPIERGDGTRVWVEPFGLTKDLCQWCGVDHVLPHLGPPLALWQWYEDHPDGYDYFRAAYHEALAKSPYRRAMVELYAASRHEDFTLLYQGDDPAHNSATALYEFLADLGSYIKDEP